MKTDEAKEPREYTKNAKQETENKWKGKQMHGQYVTELTGVDWENGGCRRETSKNEQKD